MHCRVRRPGVLLATAAGVWLLLATVALAQEGTTLTPNRLTIAGARGAREERNLLLRTSQPITNLQLIPLDLTSADGKAIFPAAAIQPGAAPDHVDAGAYLVIPIAFDLGRAPSGAFSGELLVTYAGGVQAVTVTVTVKDPWPLPLLVLVVGVALGVAGSAYRASGRARDRILVRAGQLRARLQAGSPLALPFQQRIAALQAEAEIALQEERWEASRQALEKAEMLWLKWRQREADWSAQFAHYQSLRDRLAQDDLKAEVPYLQALRRSLESIAAGAPDLADPSALRASLDAATQQINRYLELTGELTLALNLRSGLPVDEQKAWKDKIDEWKRRLDYAAPDDNTAVDALAHEIDDAIKDLNKRVGRPSALTPEGAKALTLAAIAQFVSLLAAPPGVRPTAPDTSARGAEARLRLFMWVSYGIVLVLLAGAGFNELYVASATFGADAGPTGWGDYFALLAWGFGAEATRAAITELVQGWQLPGVAARPSTQG